MKDKYNKNGKTKRTYRLRLPKGKPLKACVFFIILVSFLLGYDNTKAYPLVFKAHGLGGNSDKLKEGDFGKLQKKTEDFILVLPDGVSKNWNTSNYEGVYGKQ